MITRRQLLKAAVIAPFIGGPYRPDIAHAFHSAPAPAVAKGTKAGTGGLKLGMCG